MKCDKCGGKGFIIHRVNGLMGRKACECSVVRDYRDKIEPVNVSKQELADKIPSPYFREEEFDPVELKETIDIPEHLMDIQIDMYIEFLDTYIRTLRMGSRPTKSYLVVAPPGSGKKVFVYTAIKSAFRGGLKPSGLIDTHDVYELMDNKKFGEIKNLLKGDVAFLTMGGSPARSDIIALRTVMDICDRQGIPLVVISRFSASFITKMDPMLVATVGTFSTKKGQYGRLEHVGFSEEFMYQYRGYMKNAGAGAESAADYKERVRRGEE